MEGLWRVWETNRDKWSDLSSWDLTSPEKENASILWLNHLRHHLPFSFIPVPNIISVFCVKSIIVHGFCKLITSFISQVVCLKEHLGLLKCMPYFHGFGKENLYMKYCSQMIWQASSLVSLSKPLYSERKPNAKTPEMLVIIPQNWNFPLSLVLFIISQLIFALTGLWFSGNSSAHLVILHTGVHD